MTLIKNCLRADNPCRGWDASRLSGEVGQMEASDAEIQGKGGGSASGEPRGVKPIDYIRGARAHLKSGAEKAAYQLLLKAAIDYPEEPLILSYYGCLQTIVDRKYRNGIDNCRKALVLFKAADTYTAGVIFPTLYLNLGRAYLAAGKKKDAVEALDKGLKFDKSHYEIRKEMQLLGMRKKPPVPFLDRSNPINKYLGILLHEGSREAKRKSVRC